MPNNLEAIFLEGIELNKDKLFRICTVYASSNDDAGDLFQDALVNIWHALPDFKDNSSLATWMFRITLNICLRLNEKQTKRKEIFINLDHSKLEKYRGQAHDNEPNLPLAQLRSCIKKLKDADKSIITLYLEELPYKEISEITGISENTIAVKVKRIKNKLFNCMKEGV